MSTHKESGRQTTAWWRRRIPDVWATESSGRSMTSTGQQQQQPGRRRQLTTSKITPRCEDQSAAAECVGRRLASMQLGNVGSSRTLRASGLASDVRPEVEVTTAAVIGTSPTDPMSQRLLLSPSDPGGLGLIQHDNKGLVMTPDSSCMNWNYLSSKTTLSSVSI